MFLKTFKRSLSNASHKNTLTSNQYSKRLSNSGNYSEDWEKLREERLRMDNYTCQKCGKTMREAQFYTYKDGSKTKLCKQCKKVKSALYADESAHHADFEPIFVCFLVD